jgi:hypothetical protein
MWWLLFLFLVSVSADTAPATSGQPIITNVCFIPSASASKPNFYVTYTFDGYTGTDDIVSYRFEYISRDVTTHVTQAAADLVKPFTSTPLGTCDSSDPSSLQPKRGTLFFTSPISLFSSEIQIRMKLSTVCTWVNTGAQSDWSDWYQADPNVQAISWLNKDTYGCPAPAIDSVCQTDGSPDTLSIHWLPVPTDNYPKIARQAVVSYLPDGGTVKTYSTVCKNDTVISSLFTIPTTSFGPDWNTGANGRLAINFYSSCPIIPGATVMSDYWQGNTTEFITLNKCYRAPPVPDCPTSPAITDVPCQVNKLTGLDKGFGWYVFIPAAIGALLVLGALCVGFYYLIKKCVEHCKCCHKTETEFTRIP